MRLPGRGVVLTDPGVVIAELVGPAHHLQVPLVALLQLALRRMGRHREISEFHGFSSSLLFFVVVVWAQPGEITCPGCGRMMAAKIETNADVMSERRMQVEWPATISAFGLTLSLVGKGGEK